MSRIISIASGKGGVGKTSLTVNLAYCLALQDERTCLVDADLGLANVDILLGLEPKHTLEQAVLSDQISLRDCLIPVHDNLDILPGASGVPSLAGLESQQRRALLQGLQELQEYDYLLIDNSPGIIPSVVSFCLASRELVIVLTPESTSIADAYGLLKSLKQNGLQYPPFLVINKIRSKRQAQKIWHRFREVCKTKLGLSLMFLGLVPMQEAFEQAQHQQQPLVQTMPDCAAARSFWTMARRLRSRPRQELFKLHIQEFWNQALLQYTERSHWIATQQGQESDKEQLNPEERLERIQHDFRQLLQSNSNTWDLETLRSILKELHAELDQAWSRLEEKADAKTDYAQHLIGIKVPDQIRQILFDFMALIPQFEVRSIDDSPEELQNIAALICSEQGLLDLLDSPNLPYVQQVPTLLLSSWGTGPAPQKLPDWLEIKKVLAPPYDLQELQFALHNIVQETQQRDSKTENDQQAT